MLVPITEADHVFLDLRYASSNNVARQRIYARPIALLLPEARERLLAAVSRTNLLGLRLKIFDAFRPLEAQQILWDAVGDKRYVADPARGGIHSRGAAIDLTLADATSGSELPMGTDFDAMTELSAHSALALSPETIRNRALLLGLMIASGWSSYQMEWWHYHLADYKDYPPLRSRDVPDGPM